MKSIIFSGLFVLSAFSLAQPVRFLHSGSVPDSIFHFLQLNEKLMDNFGFELEDIRIRLALFDELTYDESNPPILRISHFSSNEESRIVKFYKSQDSIVMTCKFEGDNTIDLSDFHIEKLTKGELRTLENELKKNKEGIFLEYIQKIVSKAVIVDSLSFQYSQLTTSVDVNMIDRLLNGLSKLGIDDAEPLNQVDLNPNNVPSIHDYRAMWLLEWNDNGIQKAYVRKSPDQNVEIFMLWALSKCDQSQFIQSK